MLSRISFFLIVIFFFCACDSKSQESSDTLETSGKASFYHDNFQGLETSSGDIYDKNDFTAAHKTLPFNTFVHVTNKQNEKSIVVRINDRGPFRKSRIIDLTRSAAQKIGMVPFGVVPVRIQVLDILDYVPVNDNLLAENEVWDCYGNKMSIDGISVYVWKTEYWKHAFYMASDIVVNYAAECVAVKAVGDVNHRLYYLMVTGFATKKDAAALANALIMDGFRGARVLK